LDEGIDRYIGISRVELLSRIAARRDLRHGP
jgi:hypothetical protein